MFFNFLLTNRSLSLRGAAPFIAISSSTTERNKRILSDSGGLQPTKLHCGRQRRQHSNRRDPKRIWGRFLWGDSGGENTESKQQYKGRDWREMHRQPLWCPGFSLVPSSLYICWKSWNSKHYDVNSSAESRTQMCPVWKVLYLPLWTAGAPEAPHRREPIQVLSVRKGLQEDLWSVGSQADTVHKSSICLHQMW